MVRIQWIVPYTETWEVCRQQAEAVKRKDMEIELIQVFTQDDERLKHCSADIVIARGITARTIQRYNPDVQIVDIQVGFAEVIHAILRCRDEMGVKKAAIILAKPLEGGVEELGRACGIELEQYGASTMEEICRAVEAASSHGAEAFLGGENLRLICEEKGLLAIHVLSGPNALKQALNEAVNIGTAINRRLQHASFQKHVLDSMKEAVVVIDGRGIIIQVNKQVYDTVHLKENMVGKSIETLCKGLDWQESLSSGLEMDSVQEINRQFVLVSLKPLNMASEGPAILVTFQNVDNIKETESKIRRKLAEKGLTARYHFEDIIGESEELKQAVTMAYYYSRTDSNVLLLGESGTGKELFAHSIHNASRRKHQPFVAVNCAALPENLLESELFGYVGGAFSGAAKEGKAGLFELAHRGTIFLDEIGEMPMNLQAKLLRVLQEKEIRRIGDDKIIPVDVRVISATNIHMQDMIKEHKFRSDLYYRINLLQISVPSLRERRGDILLLADHFMNRFAVKYDVSVPVFTEKAKADLLVYSWPGNVRELQNVCERIVVLPHDVEITSEDLKKMKILEEDTEEEAAKEKKKRKTMSQEEMAAMMGVSRTTLWRRRKQMKEDETHS